MVDIYNIKFTNDFSTTPTNSLVGGLGAKVTCTIEFFVHWELLGKDLTFLNDQIVRNDGGSWITEGWRVGQHIYVDYVGTDSTPYNYGEYEIVNISTDIITVAEVTNSESHSDLVNGTLPFTFDLGFNFNIYGTETVKNIDFYYGLVENSASASFASLLDGEIQKYTKNGLDTTQGNTYSLDIANTNKSWITGTSTDITNTTIAELGLGYTGVSTGYEQCFKITLPFYISPAFLETFVDTNGELNQNLFSELAGANSLKFVYKIDAGTDGLGTIFSTDQGNINAFTNNGAVGFYDEYRNLSTTPEYSITSIEYLDPNGDAVDSLIKNATTSVTITIASATGKFANNLTRVATTVYEIPEDFADVQNNANTLFTNFDVSYKSVIEGTAASTNNNIIDYEVTYIDVNTIEVSFDYSPPSADKKYLIVCETADEGDIDMLTTDGMTMLADYNEFEFQIDLSEVYSSNGIWVNEHSSNDINRAFTDYRGWIEDGVLFTNEFEIANTGGYSSEFTISLRNVVCKIEAVNASDSTRNFTLEEFTLLPPNEDEGRSFQLPTGDAKNYLKIEEVASSISATTYEVQYATKLRWETWLTQANADPDFVSATKDWHEYITGNWSVKMNMYFNLSAIDTNSDRFNFEVIHGTDLGIKDYDEYDGCEITGVLETFHEPTMTDLQGQISKTANTFVRATFYGRKLFPCVWSPDSECTYTQILSGSGSSSDSNGDISALGCKELYGILELDDEQSGGQNFIRQISTMYDPETDTPWIGEAGVRAKITLYPYATVPCAVVEAVLDVDLLDLSANYKLSARVGEVSETICLVSIFYGSTESGTFLLYSNNDLIGYAENDLLIFGNGLNQDSYLNIVSYIAPDIYFKAPLRALRICCAANGRIDDTKGAGPSYVSASLVGLSEDDFLFFTADGKEATTQSTGYTFTSGTGTMAYTGNNGAIIIDFRPALISGTLSAQTTYTNALLQGLTLQDVLIFHEGYEATSTLAVTDLTGSTLTFNSAVTGKFKICLVNV